MHKQLAITLDFHKKRSISDQLQEEMLRLIESGILQPGDQLPTVRSLAAQLQVNFNTVARVYRVLDREGLIYTHQGRGSYVSQAVSSSSSVMAPTPREQIEQIIIDLFEKANRMHISLKELQSAFLRQVRQKRRSKISSSRKKFLAQKKRVAIPVWVRDIHRANPTTTISGPRRRLNQNIRVNVSRETEKQEERAEG